MISVAMATYNGEKYIVEQLDSIYNQTVKADEVIICDDCSKDNTQSIIRNYIVDKKLENKWKLYINEKQLGYIENFRKAITLTAGEYIFLSDQDDIFYPNKFEKMINVMHTHDDCMLLNANFEIIDENGIVTNNMRDKSRKRVKGIRKIDFRQWLFESCFPGFSMCLRYPMRDRIKNADFRNCYGHDIILGLIALDSNGNYEMDEVLSGYRMHFSNVTGGKNITNDYTVSNRVKQKNKELSEYKLLKNVITDNDFSNIDMDFLTQREKELKRRIDNLESGKIIPLVKLMLFTKAYPKRTIIGDMVYTIRSFK